MDNKDTVQIKQATVEDLDYIVPLFDHYRVFYGQQPNLLLAREFIFDRLVRRESILFLAYGNREKAALGFTQLYPSFSSVAMKSIWILNDLFVVPEARAKGIANKLLLASKEFSRKTGAIRISLCTAIDNQIAQNIYESQNFVKDASFLHYNFCTSHD